MILKGTKSAELETLAQQELTEKLMRDLWENCKHHLTFEKADPNGYIPITVCKICGKEGVFK